MNQPPENSQKRFALVLTTHRLWGKIFLPYIISSVPGKKYFILTECLSPYPSDDTLKKLDSEEIELLRITNEYSDRPLFRLYSRDKSVKEFLENVSQDKIEKFIRPYIENRLRKCYFLLRDESIPCYISRSHSNIVHPEDRLVFLHEPAIPLFSFERTSEGIIYRLRIESEGKKIELFRNPIDILCNKPCIIRNADKVLIIKDIDGQKLRPFILKEAVIVPASSEVKYFSGFVLNAVNNYKTEGTGFSIIYPDPEKKAAVSLENSIMGYPVLILSFFYSGIPVSPDDRSEHFTVFENRNGEFIFYKYTRDLIWETRCREILSESGFNSDDSLNYYLQDENLKPVRDLYRVVEALNAGYANLLSAGFTVSSRHLDKDYNLRTVSIEVINKKEGDWFDLSATIMIGELKFPFIRFKNNILNDIREFELPDGSIAILPAEWFTKYRSIFEFGRDKNGKISIHKQHFPLLTEILKEEEKASYKYLEKLLIPEELPLPVKPSGLNCEMRSYQYEGLGWLFWLQSSGMGGCLADDMGLGKTIQALALLQLNKETGSVSATSPLKQSSQNAVDSSVRLTSLIIAPPTIIHNWENEIQKFVPGMTVYRHKGAQRDRNNLNFAGYDIILSSYHTVRQDIDIFESFHFHYIILDESQYIKNPSSQIYKSVIRLRSDFKLVLTGTPVENSITDLWAQLNFVNPGLLGSLSYFRNEFAKPIETERNDAMEVKLKKLIKPFILRRTKEMVTPELPPVTEQTVFCEMTEEQAKIYEEEKSVVRNLIMSGTRTKETAKTAIVVLQGLMKLRQISNHPQIADEDYKGGSGKFETVLNDIENVIYEGHKILVFSSFVTHLNLFSKALEDRNTRFSILTGVSSNRKKIIESFQNDPDNRVFLISLKTGGVGLNLTSADYVFILDPWWNPAAEIQALSRAHRIGQDRNVFVYRYITSGTLEEKIVKLQEKKSKLAETFVASSNPLRDIDMMEILEIIG